VNGSTAKTIVNNSKNGNIKDDKESTSSMTEEANYTCISANSSVREIEIHEFLPPIPMIIGLKPVPFEEELDQNEKKQQNKVFEQNQKQQGSSNPSSTLEEETHPSPLMNALAMSSSSPLFDSQILMPSSFFVPPSSLMSKLFATPISSGSLQQFANPSSSPNLHKHICTNELSFANKKHKNDSKVPSTMQHDELPDLNQMNIDHLLQQFEHSELDANVGGHG